MRIEVNGNEKKIESDRVAALIQELGIKEKFLAVSKNGTIISRTNWEREKIVENDKIEIMSIVGGG